VIEIQAGSFQNSSHSPLLPPPATASFFGVATALAGDTLCLGKAAVAACRTGDAGRTP